MSRVSKTAFLIALLCGAFTLSCGRGEPVVIGLSIDLSGPNSENGQAVREGVSLAVDYANAKGGIDGRPLLLHAVDDRGSARGAQESVTELAQSGVVAIIGNYTSTQTLASYPLAEEHKIPLISPSASTSALSGKDDYFFRIAVSTSAEARAFAQYVARGEREGLIAIVLDTDNPGFTEDFAAVFNDELGKLEMDTSTPFEFSSNGRGDFERLVARLAVMRPRGVLILANAIDSALLAQVIRRSLPETGLYGSPWSQGSVLIQNGGAAVEGMTLILPSDGTRRNPGLDAFSHAYRNRFGWTPIYSAVEGFDLARLLTDAIVSAERTGSPLREVLKQTRDFATLDGTRISFDPYGDVIRNMYIVVVKDGEFVTTSALLIDF